MVRVKTVAFEVGAVESSKTRGEDEGSGGGGRCATAIVCALVPPDAARWSARMQRKSATNKKCGGDFARGKEEKMELP